MVAAIRLLRGLGRVAAVPAAVAVAALLLFCGWALAAPALVALVTAIPWRRGRARRPPRSRLPRRSGPRPARAPGLLGLAGHGTRRDGFAGEGRAGREGRTRREGPGTRDVGLGGDARLGEGGGARGLLTAAHLTSSIAASSVRVCPTCEMTCPLIRSSAASASWSARIWPHWDSG